MSEHKGQTDEVTTVTLPSAIEAVQWAGVRAAPGATVGLDVSTRFVGNGATLQIKITDHRGKTHGSFKDQIHNNRLSAEVSVPPSAREALYAEVNFPKHGLSASSPALLLTPPIEVDNAAWSQDEARRGDVLTLSADVQDAPDGTGAQIEIFEHDADGAHDPVTKFKTLVDGGSVTAEWEYEYHEDTDDIPRDEEAEKGYQPPEYFFRVEVEGIIAESGLLTFKDWFAFSITDIDGKPLADESYTLRLADGSTRAGTLDENGSLEEKDIPPGKIEVEFDNFDYTKEIL